MLETSAPFITWIVSPHILPDSLVFPSWNATILREKGPISCHWGLWSKARMTRSSLLGSFLQSFPLTFTLFFPFLLFLFIMSHSLFRGVGPPLFRPIGLVLICYSAAFASPLAKVGKLFSGPICIHVFSTMEPVGPIHYMNEDSPVPAKSRPRAVWEGSHSYPRGFKSGSQITARKLAKSPSEWRLARMQMFCLFRNGGKKFLTARRAFWDVNWRFHSDGAWKCNLSLEARLTRSKCWIN